MILNLAITLAYISCCIWFIFLQEIQLVMWRQSWMMVQESVLVLWTIQLVWYILPQSDQNCIPFFFSVFIEFHCFLCDQLLWAQNFLLAWTIFSSKFLFWFVKFWSFLLYSCGNFVLFTLMGVCILGFFSLFIKKWKVCFLLKKTKNLVLPHS